MCSRERVNINIQQGVMTLYVDVMIKDSTIESYHNHTQVVLGAVQFVENKKMKKHKVNAERVWVTFVPYIVESFRGETL